MVPTVYRIKERKCDAAFLLINRHMTPKLEMSLYDNTVFKLRLPLLRRRIAVLVSGGLDSALLYYLVKKLSLDDDRYTVIPYTLERNDGSKSHAQLVIDYVHDILKIDRLSTSYIPLSNTDSNLQVAEGITLVLKKSINLLYMGHIKTLPEHALHGVPTPYVPVDYEGFNNPFKDLTKAHVVDLVTKLNIEKIFELTHSCVYDMDDRCNVCNRCNERAWAFEQLGLIDPGTK